LFYFIEINHFDKLSSFWNTLKCSAFLDLSWTITLFACMVWLRCAVWPP